MLIKAEFYDRVCGALVEKARTLKKGTFITEMVESMKWNTVPPVCAYVLLFVVLITKGDPRDETTFIGPMIAKSEVLYRLCCFRCLVAFNETLWRM